MSLLQNFIFFIIISQSYFFTKRKKITLTNTIEDINEIALCAEEGLTHNKCIGTVTILGENGQPSKYINYLSKCKEGNYCQSVSYTNDDIGFCTPIIHQGRPGDKCHNKGDCYSFNCTNSKCYGKKNGELCLSSLECEINSACVFKDHEHSNDDDPKYCTSLVISGNSCMFGSPPIQRKDTYYETMFNFKGEREDNCYPGYICAIATGNLDTFKNRLNINDYICISKFSILDGQYIDYGNYLACEEGYMTLHNESDGLNYGICRKIVTDGYCDEDEKCIADNDGNRINCVYDIVDELFCPVYGMKDRIKNYTKVFNHAIATAGINFDIMMNKETADKENVRSAYLYLKYFQWFRNADECQIAFMMYVNHSGVRFGKIIYIWVFIIILIFS